MYIYNYIICDICDICDMYIYTLYVIYIYIYINWKNQS